MCHSVQKRIAAEEEFNGAVLSASDQRRKHSRCVQPLPTATTHISPSGSQIPQHFDPIVGQLFEDHAIARRMHGTARLLISIKDRIHLRVSENNPGAFSSLQLFDEVFIPGMIIQNPVIDSIQLRVSLFIALARSFIQFQRTRISFTQPLIARAFDFPGLFSRPPTASTSSTSL